MIGSLPSRIVLRGAFLLLSVGALDAAAGGRPKGTKATPNPLMPAFNQPIAFSKATKADVQQATTYAIANTKTALTAIYNVPTAQRTFTNTMLPLDALTNKLSSVAGPLDILVNASPDSAVPTRPSEALPSSASIATS